MPMIDLNPSDTTCIFSTLHFIYAQAKRSNTTPVLTFDQPLWWKALGITSSEPDGSDLKHIVLHLGPFHLKISFLACSGHLMEETVLHEKLSTVYAPNAASNMHQGKAVLRAIRGHILVDAAQSMLLLSDTFRGPLSLPESDTEKNRDKNTQDEQTGTLSNPYESELNVNQVDALTIDKDTDVQLHGDLEFVGPASTVDVQCNVSPRVEVRTKGQLVAELGWRLAQLILTLEQLDLMNRDPKLVCITGPPGTGKTVVLVLQAVRWILQGRDVHVVSTRCASWAVSILIQRQITSTATKAATRQQQKSGKAILHEYDINNPEDVTRAVKELSEAAGRDGKLCVILDEAVFHSSTQQGQLHNDLVTQLIDAVPQLHLWAVCVLYEGIPKQLRTEVFTTPLRCAPVVIRQLQPAISRFDVHKYSDNAIPSPADGPSVICLSHHGKGHVGQWPVECPQCGCDVAAELRSLGVGTKGTDLRYRDVFILTRSSELQDDVKDDAGNLRSPASGAVLGLRAANLPIVVLARQIRGQDRKRWEREMEDVALAKSDRIVVAHGVDVTGLERKIVVTLQGRFLSADERSSHIAIESSEMLVAVSRCTTQLIMVTVPASTERDSTTSTKQVAKPHSQTSASHIVPKTVGKVDTFLRGENKNRSNRVIGYRRLQARETEKKNPRSKSVSCPNIGLRPESTSQKTGCQEWKM
ncbi:uncharacterized protein [Littorina saxatilis]|uniref:uncharacterized protein n=1 Tax=Littorina saxatilis TaxID=31220 RepID=UPI0038B5F72F